MKKWMASLLTAGMLVSTLQNGYVSAKKAKISLNKTKLTLNVKQKYTLKLKGSKKQASIKSSKKSVVKVAKKYKTAKKKKKLIRNQFILTGVKAGKAKITVKVKGKKYICKVTVKGLKKKSIKKNDSNSGMPSVADTSQNSSQQGNSNTQANSSKGNTNSDQNAATQAGSSNAQVDDNQGKADSNNGSASQSGTSDTQTNNNQEKSGSNQSSAPQSGSSITQKDNEKENADSDKDPTSQTGKSDDQIQKVISDAEKEIDGFEYDNITADNIEKFDKVIAAYKAVGENHVSQIGEAERTKYNNLFKQYNEFHNHLKNVDKLVNQIDTKDLWNNADMQKLIQKADDAYNDLTDDERKFYDANDEKSKKLNKAVETWEDIRADQQDLKDLKESLDDLDDKDGNGGLHIDDFEELNETVLTYNYLKEENHLDFSEDEEKVYKRLSEQRDNLAVEWLNNKISKLPQAKEINGKNYTDVSFDFDEINEIYDTLNGAYLNKLTPQTIDHYNQVRKRLQELDDAYDQAQPIINQIVDLPQIDDITTSDENKIKKAYQSFEKASDDVKSMVDVDLVAILNNDYQRLTILQKVSKVEYDIQHMTQADTPENYFPFSSEVKLVSDEYETLGENENLVNKDVVDLLKKKQKRRDELSEEYNKADQLRDQVKKLTQKKLTKSDLTEINQVVFAYDHLNDEEKVFLRDVSQSIHDLKQKKELWSAQTTAQAVDAMISQISPNVSLKDKSQIEDVRAAYESLTDDEKTEVTQLDHLKSAEEAIIKLEKEKAQDITKQIDQLPEKDDLRASDEKKVKELSQQYKNLDASIKAYIPKDSVNKLDGAVDALNGAKQDTAGLIQEIDNLPDEDHLTLEYVSQLKSIRNKYNQLSEMAQSFVDLTKLEKAENQMTVLEAKDVTERINNLPSIDEATLNDESDIEGVAQSYYSLARRDLVTNSVKLMNLRNRMDALKNAKKKAQELTDTINGLYEKNLTLKDEDSLKSAQSSFNQVTDDEKKYLNVNDLSNKLDIIESKIQFLKNQTTSKENVIKLIENLPDADEITFDNKDQVSSNVENARNAYDALDSHDADTINTSRLTLAENKLKQLENAQKVIDEINNLPQTKNLSLDDEEKVSQVFNDYLNLESTVEKNLVSNRQRLFDCRNRLVDLKNVQPKGLAVNERIDKLPDVAIATLKDEKDIRAVQNDYESLGDDGRSFVSDANKTKLKQLNNLMIELETKRNYRISAVRNKIEHLPEVNELTLNEEEDLKAAVNAYNELSEDDRKELGEDFINKLNDLEKQMSSLKSSDTKAATTGLDNNLPSQADIINYVKNNDIDTFYQDEYTKLFTERDSKTLHDVSDAGELTQASQQKALNYFNAMRYVAGLNPVSLDTDYEKYAQCSAYIEYIRNEMNHYPAQGNDITTELHDLGYQGSRNGNLGKSMSEVKRDLQYMNLSSSIDNWFADSIGQYNVSTLGHRRWCLNPRMGKTGFGAAYGTSLKTSDYPYVKYTSMYAHDKSNINATQSGIAWPAANMPTDYFKDILPKYQTPWSYLSGTQLKDQDVTVTLTLTHSTAAHDKKQWVMNKTKSNDGIVYTDYMKWSNGRPIDNVIGYSDAVIFMPEGIKVKAGDVYNVKITGIGKEVNYDVHFFDL